MSLCDIGPWKIMKLGCIVMIQYCNYPIITTFSIEFFSRGVEVSSICAYIQIVAVIILQHPLLVIKIGYYCKPFNIGSYLIWLSLVIFSVSLKKAMCNGGYLIWRFSGPSQISQLKSPPNMNRFTVYKLIAHAMPPSSSYE